jgi:hypothetical protein
MTMIEVEPQPRIDTLVRLPSGDEARRTPLSMRPPRSPMTLRGPDLDSSARQRPPWLAAGVAYRVTALTLSDAVR